MAVSTVKKGDTFEFNTGRHYGPEGQRITCEVYDIIPCRLFGGATVELSGDFIEFVVKFEDHTRKINQIVIIPDFTQKALMRAYDDCRYYRQDENGEYVSTYNGNC